MEHDFVFNRAWRIMEYRNVWSWNYLWHPSWLWEYLIDRYYYLRVRFQK